MLPSVALKTPNPLLNGLPEPGKISSLKIVTTRVPSLENHASLTNENFWPRIFPHFTFEFISVTNRKPLLAVKFAVVL